MAAMRRFAFAAFLALALILAGCAAKENGEGAKAAEPASYGKGFTLPQTPVEYTATYTVDEEGAQTQKKVWRSGSRMRIALLSGGGSSLGMYFVNGRAYSCADVGSGMSCFEITGRVDAQAAAQLAVQPDFSSAEPAEEVDIGGTKGKCYLFPYKVFEKRKMCFTDRGVLAFDQYNVTSGRVRTEYLTELKYGVDARDFELPATPRAAPAATEN